MTKKKEKKNIGCHFKNLRNKDTGINIDKIKPMIEYSTRLGKSNPEFDHRPILVKLKDTSLREKLLEAKGNTKQREFNIMNGTKYRVEPDLTSEQRQIYKQMWVEAGL